VLEDHSLDLAVGRRMITAVASMLQGADEPLDDAEVPVWDACLPQPVRRRGTASAGARSRRNPTGSLAVLSM
jgi:hypothetical protein